VEIGDHHGGISDPARQRYRFFRAAFLAGG